MSELDLAGATVETFAAAVGQVFEAVFSDGRLPLTLVEARPLGAPRAPGVRVPFALTFHGKSALRLPQRVYRLENATLGTMEIFLVQVALDANQSTLEAIFN